jgi:hypothetical protein
MARGLLTDAAAPNSRPGLGHGGARRTLATRSDRRISLSAGILLLVATGARSAHADSEVDACISAHADGQVLHKNKRLLAARAKFQACASDRCPGLIRDDCQRFGEQVDTSLPRLVLAASDEQGRVLTDVRVLLDNRPFVSRLDGRPLALDPGAHRLRFETTDGQSRELFVVAQENQDLRRISADFRKDNAQRPPSEPASAVPTASYVLGGIGVLALGSFAYFGMRGNATKDCARPCSQDEVDRMNSQYLIADISLGIGLVSLGAATYLLFTRPSPSASPSAAQVSLRLASRPSGAALEAVGQF